MVIIISTHEIFYKCLIGFNFNIHVIDFIKNYHVQYRDIVAKFKSQFYIDRTIKLSKTLYQKYSLYLLGFIWRFLPQWLLNPISTTNTKILKSSYHNSSYQNIDTKNIEPAKPYWTLKSRRAWSIVYTTHTHNTVWGLKLTCKFFSNLHYLLSWPRYVHVNENAQNSATQQNRCNLFAQTPHQC